MNTASDTLLAFGVEPRSAMRRQHAHLSDEALVALVARGDEHALGELYDRIGRIAYGFRAERAKASTWILTLVHRRAVDTVRREERRRAEPLGDEAAAGLGDPQASTEEAAWLRFERERVQFALGKLPDVQREALELAYYGGFTQSELAERLGVPIGTIKSRMFAGLSRLRELLDDSSEEGSWKPELTG